MYLKTDQRVFFRCYILYKKGYAAQQANKSTKKDASEKPNDTLASA